MQFKHFMFLGAMAAAMVSCGSDDVMSEGNGNVPVKDKGYMSLSIAVGGEKSTRGLKPGDKVDAGTLGEQKVSKISILLSYTGKDNQAHFDIHNIEAKDLIPGGPNNPAVKPGEATYYTTKPIPVEKGKKKVVVLVNADFAQVNKLNTIAKLREAQVLANSNAVAGISTDNNFLMTNAVDIITEIAENTPAADKTTMNNGDFYVDGSVYVDVQGNLATPTTVTVPVERAVAKLKEITNDYKKAVVTDKDRPAKTATGDFVHFEELALINGNTKFYPIKKIRKNDGVNDYVVDPNFEGQSEATRADFYSKDFTPNTGDAIWQPLPKKVEGVDIEEKDRTVFYTLENTMTKDDQYNAYTTGVYYKATYELKGVTKGTNLYKFNGKLYTFQTLEDSKLVQLKPEGKEPLTDASSIDQFKEIGVAKYPEGVCYYPFYIRHVDNGNPNELGVMEFGVVRNNCYTLNVNSVTGIGQNVPVNPEPETPDERDGMLEVVVKVMPWTVRNNNIDF